VQNLKVGVENLIYHYSSLFEYENQFLILLPFKQASYHGIKAFLKQNETAWK